MINKLRLLSAAIFFITSFIGLPADAETNSANPTPPPTHIPTIDLFPTLNWAVGKDEHGVPHLPAGGRSQGTPEINFAITEPLFRGLSFQYEHDRGPGIDSTLGQGANKSGQLVNVPTNSDVQDWFRLQYVGVRNITLSAGYNYRSRHNNVATNDPTNLTPTAWHIAYLKAEYTTPAITVLNGATFGVAFQGLENKHHVSATGLANEKGAGFSDRDGEMRYGDILWVDANFPLIKRHGHGLSASAYWGDGAFDYFDNSPVPYYYYMTDVGLTEQFSRTFSLTADVNNLVQHNNGGWPFPSPNAIHRVYFGLTAHIVIAPSESSH